MKRTVIFLTIVCQWLIVSAQRTATDSAWRAEVKTVTLTRAGVELERPVLTLATPDRLLLQFDMLADEAQNLHWSVAHCDADWRRDDLEPYEFMNGFEQGEIENYDFSFTTLQLAKGGLPEASFGAPSLAEPLEANVTMSEGGNLYLFRGEKKRPVKVALNK